MPSAQVQSKFFLSMIAAAMSVGTQANAASPCDGVLRDGVMRNSSFQNNYYSKLVIAARLSQMTRDEARSAMSAGVTVPIYGVPVSGNYSENKHRKFQQHVRQYIDVDNVISNQTSVMLSSGDQNILSAWSQCISRLGGLTMYIEPRGSDDAVVKITWTSYPGTPTDPAVRDFSVSSGVQVIGGQDFTRRGSHLGERIERTIRLSRPRNAGILVTMNLDLGSADAFLHPTINIPDMPPTYTWKYVRLGDCPAQDINCSVGAEPNDNECRPNRIGQVSVCWGNRRGGYPPFSGCGGGPASWCTYKSTTPAQCQGGAAPGSMYECVQE
jgi:hypothetical protein